MNIAEYIEQNIDNTRCIMTVSCHEFAEEVGLKDVRVAKEWIVSDLEALFKCRIMQYNARNTIQACLIEELFYTENYVQIYFSHLIHELRNNNDHWLSDILQQTRMNNYIVKGD